MIGAKTLTCLAVLSAAEAAVGLTYELETGTVTVDDATGALVSMRAKDASGAAWRSGEDGLWSLAFADGTRLCAADFATNGCSVVKDGDTFRYEHPKAKVEVRFAAKDGHVDLCGRVTGRADNAAVDFTLPGRLRFSPDAVGRFYMPQNGNAGLGLALKPDFFRRRPSDAPAAWRRVSKTGCNGYSRMFGGPVGMGKKDEPEVTVRMTDAAKALFPKTVHKVFASRLAKRGHHVNRPCRKGQFDDVLLDSEKGPFLSGSGFGGTGRLWRFGTLEDEATDTERLDFVAAIVRGLAATNRTRRTLGVVRLANCSPQRGPFAGCSADRCLIEMRTAAEKSGLSIETIGSAAALSAALAEDRHLAIVSPYGEALPVASLADFAPSLDRIKNWVRRGGHWIETGGASFYAAIVPVEYCTYAKTYPNLFLDFCALGSPDGGLVALYGVRRRPAHEPWQCPPPFRFRPGSLGCGGDAAGGYVDHGFRLYAKGGATEEMPPVRLAFAASVGEAVRDYGRANDLTKTLAEKMEPAKLETLKRAIFLKIWGSAAECRALVDDLPRPTTFHTTSFLKGFDKLYPDHLPPGEKFGTEADFRALIDCLHARGHLFSPYTNPTWWCDHPRGPTFLAAGEAPLSRKADGSFYHERYHSADGWTTCLWHPAVQAANRKTVRQFTQDFPSDLLFQDQCGARRGCEDFNSAAPSPTAYAEGMISMNEEDARVVPLGTEDGWDRVANEQVGLFGVAWGMVPLRLVPIRNSRPLTKREEIPPELWEIEPLATWLMHDKVLFWMHDLGAFVTEPRILAWMIATGYNLSESSWARTYAQKRPWIDRLAQIQRDVCSRIAGQPLVSWRHDRGPMLARRGFDPCDGTDDGIVVARWGGGIRCLVNLGDVPRTVEGVDLEPYGYRVEMP